MTDLNRTEIIKLFVNGQDVGAGQDVVVTDFPLINSNNMLLDQRDHVQFRIKSTGNNIPVGSTIKINYYATGNLGFVGTETITLPEITKDLVPIADYSFNSNYTTIADYFTLEITLKKGTAYKAYIDCIVKKKIDEDSLDFVSKSNIVDADLVAGFDSATNFSKIKTTWTSIKAFLKSYFDTLYNGIIKTGQSDPTTATVGYLGQVIFTTAGNRWTLLKIDGATYYWSPDGFPADNTEYVSHISGGQIVFKKIITGTTSAAGGSVQVAHGIPGTITFDSLSIVAMLSNGHWVDSYYNAATSNVITSVDQVNVFAYNGTNSLFLSRPFKSTLTYKRT